MTTSHRHVAQPKRQRIDSSPTTLEIRKLDCKQGLWRCWSACGDPIIVEDYCRCGARRCTPAIYSGPNGEPTHTLIWEPTGKPGEWK